MAGASRGRSAAGREIGAVPPIADVARRERCRTSLRLFAETYNPDAFYLGWSDDHLRVIARIEESATLGALYAIAMPRGSGKTSIVRTAALWALAYAYRRYVFVIGANAAKAEDAVDTLKVFARYLPLFAADFPEISHPALALGGIANRASGQTCGGESTLIEWGKARVVLPTVPPPPNWSRHWPLRADGKVPTSGAVLAASGLTGDGLRGSLLTLSTGELVRPDFALIDDPQTHESANSVAQNETRTRLISADVLGMAGPGKSIAAVMPCTVIAPGDMVDTILDRSKHPLWRGERTKLLRSMPADMAAWDRYFDTYHRCSQYEPPDYAEANAHYLAHRAALDAGAEASWEARKLPGEVSAVQHAMNLYARDPVAFYAEYQNDPRAEALGGDAALTVPLLEAVPAGPPRRVVPRTATRLTAFIDVGKHLLWYAVAAWDESFGGCLIDYGPYPDQGRAYLHAADARPALGDLPDARGRPPEAAIHAGLTRLAADLLGRGYAQEETGAELRIERCLVDANWGERTDLVYDFCRRDPNAARLLASHGKFVGASSVPMANWPVKAGERAGPGWRLAPVGRHGRHVVFDSNRWKTFVADRLRTPAGVAGSLRVFAPDAPGRHRMLWEHWTAEYPVPAESTGRRVDEWKDKPGRDNHLWDCMVGCAVAASVQGLTFRAAGDRPAPRPAVPFSEQQRRARERKKAAA